jgi:uncharacterized protein (DUF58 family)
MTEPVDGWRPSASLVRAASTSTVLVVLALVVGRPALLVLAAPLLVHTVAAFLRRPPMGETAVPTVRTRLDTEMLREGEGTTLRVELAQAAFVEHAVLALRPRRWLAANPPSGEVARFSPAAESALSLTLPVASLRWGRRPVGDGLIGASTGWGGYEWGPVAIPARTISTWPLPGPFDSRVAAPHPVGLVGAHPSRRPGDGYELESVRPFQPGDRLRRVQWPVSLRTGTLHVASTRAEQDASVLLLVDGGVEVGMSGGINGAPSSLDVAVRAAGAVAEHHLTRGDRVGVRVLGGRADLVVPVSAGRPHLRRVLETLARVVPGEERDLPERMRFRVPAGAVVTVFSSMLSPLSVRATTTLASRGLDVVVVDCLPDDVDVGGDDAARLAWRIRLLERKAMLARAEHSGIPVVRWRGPGTLDEVLRRLQRRTAMATAGRR